MADGKWQIRLEFQLQRDSEAGALWPRGLIGASLPRLLRGGWTVRCELALPRAEWWLIPNLFESRHLGSYN